MIYVPLILLLSRPIHNLQCKDVPPAVLVDDEIWEGITHYARTHGFVETVHNRILTRPIFWTNKSSSLCEEMSRYRVVARFTESTFVTIHLKRSDLGGTYLWSAHIPGLEVLGESIHR